MTNPRADQLRADASALKLKTDRAGKERGLVILGIVLMVAGIAIAFAAYRSALTVTATPGSNVDVLNSNAYGPLGMTGLATSVVGAAVFLRYSLADFFRWWLLRQSYDMQAVVEAQRSSTTS
ncbi:MAG: hypothetical protein JWO68_1535 [Actinomycetia bacterium]|nr:hypothetical protein [Actinomycetes bacterium]